jgi:SAM-dependent methyltransferase
MSQKKDTHEMVKKAYGTVAKKQKSCCGASSISCSCGPKNAETTYGELGLSCGDPVTFSHMKPGQVVLDLGSGAGKDVFLAAKIVGKSGRVIGVDMTGEMLALARKNAEEFKRDTGLDNTEFREGQIEELPVDDASVDIVISNCVINLSPDKPAVFQEVYRVLKPSGKMVVSDIVLNRHLPEAAKNDENLYVACIAGALLREDYLKAIRDAGFTSVKILSDILYGDRQGSDPVTSKVGKELSAAASSITVLAEK